MLVGSLSFVSCGGGVSLAKPPSGLTTRVLASQSVSSATAVPGLLIINGANDTLARGGIGAGSSPGLMAISPDRRTVLAFSSTNNSFNVEVVDTKSETLTGTISLPGSTTSMV